MKGKQMVSKYVPRKKKGAPQKTKRLSFKDLGVQKEVEQVIPAPIIKQKKTRKPRAFRLFRYRGVAFLYSIKGDRTTVQTIDELTNMANPGVTVPSSKVNEAKQALANIQLAEKKLDELGAEEQTDSNA